MEINISDPREQRRPLWMTDFGEEVVDDETALEFMEGRFVEEDYSAKGVDLS